MMRNREGHITKIYCQIHYYNSVFKDIFETLTLPTFQKMKILLNRQVLFGKNNLQQVKDDDFNMSRQNIENSIKKQSGTMYLRHFSGSGYNK